MLTAGALAYSGLSDDDARVLAAIAKKVEDHRLKNELKDAYYQGKERVRQLGIALPDSMRHIETVVGWPAMVVDGLEERLDLDGFVLPGESSLNEDLEEIFALNDMAMKSSVAHTDAMIFGCEFVAVSKGAEGEPDPLITIEPPTRMSGIFDPRMNRLTAAAAFKWNENGDQVVAASLYKLDENIRLAKDELGQWRVVHRDPHRFGRVTVVRLVNRPRSGRPWGVSEITSAVRSYTDQCVRALLRMEVGAEFFSVPQRVVLGADESAFVGPDGKAKTAWETYIGAILALEAIESDGNPVLPQVHQLPAASPAPHLEMIKGFAQLIGAEAAFPISYMGFVSDNPASADAARVQETRLVKRAERRQVGFSPTGWCEVARLCWLTRDSELPDGAERLAAVWRDAATPTKSASSDRVMKLIAAGVYPPDSEVTLEDLGLDRSRRERLLADQRRARAAAMASSLGAAAGDDPGEVKARADAMGVLIRAGVEPEIAAAQVGFAGLQFTGATPVSLRLPEKDAEQLEDR